MHCAVCVCLNERSYRIDTLYPLYIQTRLDTRLTLRVIPNNMISTHITHSSLSTHSKLLQISLAKVLLHPLNHAGVDLAVGEWGDGVRDAVEGAHG